MTTQKHPPLDVGTLVITTEKKLHDREWTAEARAARKWGVLGTIQTHHDSHGLCYEVTHFDGSVGVYDPSELQELSAADEAALLERTQKRITLLHNRILHQDERIDEEIVDTLLCLECNKPFTSKVQSTGQHSLTCLWRYFLECPHCKYQNNLAKIQNKDCSCNI